MSWNQNKQCECKSQYIIKHWTFLYAESTLDPMVSLLRPCTATFRGHLLCTSILGGLLTSVTSHPLFVCDPFLDFYEMDIPWVSLWTLAHGTCLSATGLLHLTQWPSIPSTCCKRQGFSLFTAEEHSLVSMHHIVLIYDSGHWNSFHFFPFVSSVPTLSIPDLLLTIKPFFWKAIWMYIHCAKWIL